MKFLEALRLRSKLFFLFILITFGLLSVSVMGYTYTSAMKKNMDSLYFGSLVPVTELNDILQTYHNPLAWTVYKASRLEISPSQTSLDIQEGLNTVRKRWKSYESHYKREEELAYVEYTDMEIRSLNNYFKKIIEAANNEQNLQNISMTTLESKISHIHNVIKKLINYEVEVATYDRKVFTNQYSHTLSNIGFLLAMSILAILGISFYVFKSIQNDHTRLEIATKKLKRANKKLEDVSYTDELTSLHNRRYFNMIYEKEINRAKRNNSYITFMMLDIDFFKQYNDTYGHLEGDNTLKAVAKVLKSVLKRPGDFIFRLGGEEFGVLLTQTDESSSAMLARELCDTVRALEIEHTGSQIDDVVTISLGVVCCVADEALEDEILLSRSDEMLYEAKATGRDRYIITSNVSQATTVKMSA